MSGSDAMMEDSHYASEPAGAAEPGPVRDAVPTPEPTPESGPSPTPEPSPTPGPSASEPGSGGPASPVAGSPPTGPPADEGTKGLNDEDSGSAPDEQWAQGDRRRRDRLAGWGGVDVQNVTRVRSVRSASGPTVVGTGGYAIGTLTMGAKPDVALTGGLNPDWVRTLVDLHVGEAAAEQHWLERLDAHNVIYVCGDRRAGRQHEAVHQLAVRCGPDKVQQVDLDPGAGLAGFLNQRDVLQAGHGHVLELHPGEPVRRSTLRAAGGIAHKAGAHLVILGPLPAEGLDDLADFAVVHRRPNATAVLRRHLMHQLCCDGRMHFADAQVRCHQAEAAIRSWVDQCLDDEKIATYLRSGPVPQDAVELARRLADLHRSGRPPAEALELLSTSLRRRGVEVLAPPPEPPPASDEEARSAQIRAHTRMVAFRIAYAVFYDHPLSNVFDADRVLHALVDTDPGAVRADTVFDGGVNALLHPKMRVGAGAEADLPQDDDGALPRLVDPGLARAILDVAWNEYDRIREPLLRWLAVLAADHRERVRWRAAQAAGQLASYDYRYVYRELLRPWAVSPLVRHRQTASWTVEFLVAQDPGQLGRVRSQLRDWAGGSNVYMNDTAARAYATSLGAGLFDDMLLSLRYIASKRPLTVSTAVAQAIAECYQPEVAGTIVEALHSWVRDGNPSLRLHAARTVVFLAHRPAPPPDEAWPALLLLARHDDKSRRQLVRVWQAALTEPAAMRAWEMQRSWLVGSDGRGDLEDAAAEFAAELWRPRLLRVRAVHHLERIWTDDADLPVMRRVRMMLKENSHDHVS